MATYTERIQAKINYHVLQARRARKMLENKLSLVPDPYPLLPVGQVWAEIRHHERMAVKLLDEYNRERQQPAIA